LARRVYFTVYLPESIAVRVEAEAARRGWSISRLLREALLVYLGLGGEVSGNAPLGPQPPAGDRGEDDPLLGLAIRPRGGRSGR
jgi:hypothetical protein